MQTSLLSLAIRPHGSASKSRSRGWLSLPNIDWFAVAVAIHVRLSARAID